MSFKKTLLTAACALSFSLSAGAAFAQMTQTQINAALDQKDLASIQNTLSRSKDDVDPIVRAMTQKTQAVIKQDPDFSTQMMKIVGANANNIKPASVPVVCADMRRIASTLTPEQKGTPLFAAVASTAVQLARAPVVVSAGRPNDCENAVLQTKNLLGEAADDKAADDNAAKDGKQGDAADPAKQNPANQGEDETLLMQLPGMSGPGLPTSTIRPGIPLGQGEKGKGSPD